ncbi:DeoR/GlpR family DNA-binding transcription regulator [Parasedimentitalea maritima]|uniref:DeoR family transcriptional regulator n=1 Tax=Parasedimentitalea maritima TaxID=2578117 RepID=A0A6A4RQ25_9RHOB|nr:DeoR/GlpR family DNA-binding transcription regulator [Zongyanglinia marina]KAE9632354.1 DeoR family transcriptional regulator [Zongyanglinia marina]
MSGTQSLSHRELELLGALRRLGGSARSADLAKALDVSEETVRRTVKALSKAGAVLRVHGGAHLVGAQSEPSFYHRFGQDSAVKQRIAAQVSRIVRDGMTVFLDVGSTTAYVAEALQRNSNLTVVTNSIGVAQALASHNGNRVHLLGGEMQSNERGTFGYVAEHQARRFVFDVAVLSADALTAKHGVLYQNAGEAQLATVVADCAECTVLALAHPKFDETAPHRGPSLGKLDRIVSDKAPGKKLTAALAGHGIGIDIAKDGSGEDGK